MAKVINFPSSSLQKGEKEVYWDLLGGLPPIESAEILLGDLVNYCPFNIEGNIPGYPGSVVIQIFSPHTLEKILQLEVWGSEEKTTYIKLTIIFFSDFSEFQLNSDNTIEFETGIESPLTRDGGETLDKMLEHIKFVAQEQRT